MTTLTKRTWREEWRQIKLARLAVPNYGGSHQFWGSKEKVRAVYMKGRGKHDDTTRERLESMAIADGARVLDIGAGPGPFALPLAERGCDVTVVEPSQVMREALAGGMDERGISNIRVIPKRWEDVTAADLGERYDTVIASYSLTMMDIAEACSRMDAASRGNVHLFWFLAPPPWVMVNRDLWPVLHGGSFPGEPTADILWMVLREMGINASLTVERKFPPSLYASVDAAVEEFNHRLNTDTDAQRETVRNYFQSVLKMDEKGYVLPGETIGAHIWWDVAAKITGAPS